MREREQGEINLPPAVCLSEMLSQSEARSLGSMQFSRGVGATGTQTLWSSWSSFTTAQMHNQEAGLEAEELGLDLRLQFGMGDTTGELALGPAV